MIATLKSVTFDPLTTGDNLTKLSVYPKIGDLFA
jgi:hypothetical protein